MSHGASGPDRCEPNLTPMLDMILQLVMFFMLCANFVMEQVNENIKLPTAIEAKALDRNTRDYIILNVNKDGRVLLGKGDEPGSSLNNTIQVQQFMKARLEEDRLRAVADKKAKEWEAGKGRSLIILRAHKDCSFKMVYDVMQACTQVGYQDVQLRVIQSAPTAGKAG